MKNLLLIVLTVAVAGCVVVPSNQRVETVVVYPQYGGAYMWDSTATSFYFVVNSNRYYMQHGWHPKYGYPRGHYRKY